MLTKNTDKLRREVMAHVEADRVIQGTYWDEKAQHGCFIGCLNHSDNPSGAEEEYGLPIAIQRIAETIFEALPADEARAFFAALPNAVGADGRDLSRVHWRFLASELRSLPPVDAETQAVIDPVIAGIERLAEGQQWPAEAAEAAGAAVWAARATEATEAAWAAEAAAEAAGAARATEATEVAEAAAWAARVAEAAAAAAAGAAAGAAVVRRQRDLLLRLIRDTGVQS